MAVLEEEKFCENCAYTDIDLDDEPCCDCKNNFVYNDPRYEDAPLLWKPKEEVNDVVSHPTHYTNGGMECIDEMIMVFGKETVAHFCLCNVWKYRYRALSKNGEEDIKKSHWYMAKYKELTERCTYGKYNAEDPPF